MRKVIKMNFIQAHIESELNAFHARCEAEVYATVGKPSTASTAKSGEGVESYASGDETRRVQLTHANRGSKTTRAAIRARMMQGQTQAHSGRSWGSDPQQLRSHWQFASCPVQ